jgi:hypothetical protein
MNLEVWMTDKKAIGLFGCGSIEVHHSIDGKNARLLQCMLEIQLAHGEEDIIWDSVNNTEYPKIKYHLTRKEARWLWKLLDGVSYEDNFEFDTYGTYREMIG